MPEVFLIAGGLALHIDITAASLLILAPIAKLVNVLSYN